ncbi:MAG TPA: hypothetical protein PLK90_09135 [Clostridiales bacterium]|nr:hypothetical protein [Clostridiales bacterium]HQP70549.1 hypothetical protein [Clostridiales bacterium]
MPEKVIMDNLRSVSADEFRQMGIKFFANECGSQKKYLVWWSPKEDFANFGVGHFIWLPAGSRLPFVEQFPELIAFYLEKNEPVPEFIDRHKMTGCPWKSKTDLDYDPVKDEIIEWLASTTYIQAGFILFKAMDSIKEILNKNPHVADKLKALSASRQGRFAVVDYLNFKGTGLDPKERIRGEGWGLLQVLENMKLPDLENFIRSAEETLTRRVNNYTEDWNDLTFLNGWLKRIDGYSI